MIVVVSAQAGGVPFPAGFRRGVMAAVLAFGAARIAAALHSARRAADDRQGANRDESET